MDRDYCSATAVNCEQRGLNDASVGDIWTNN